MPWQVGKRVGVGLCCSALWGGCGGQVDSDPRGLSPGSGSESSAPGRQPAVVPPPPQNPVSLVPETCDDNPLLAGCTPLPARPQDDPALSPVRRVELILEESCGSCHGQQARRDCMQPACLPIGWQFDWQYFDDLSRLVQTGQVLACNWPGSAVAERIRDGSMPPGGSGVPSMPASDQALVADYVNGICDSLTGGGAADSDRLEVELILSDRCGACHGELPAGAGRPPGGLANVADISELIAGEFLLPCNSNASPIVEVLRDGSAHLLAYPGAQTSRSKIRAIINFIDRPCRR